MCQQAYLFNLYVELCILHLIKVQLKHTGTIGNYIIHVQSLGNNTLCAKGVCACVCGVKGGVYGAKRVVGRKVAWVSTHHNKYATSLYYHTGPVSTLAYCKLLHLLAKQDDTPFIPPS